jgi:hypothetical protein
MSSRLITQYMSCWALSLPAFAAPLPREIQAPLYFPTTVGAKWVYLKDNGQEERIEVSEVEKTGEGWIVSRSGTHGNAIVYSKVKVTLAGLSKDLENGDDKPAVDWVLKSNVRSGESWEAPDGTKRTIRDPEAVVVPAGKFTAVRVETESGGTTTVSWYAAGVGEVKRVVRREGAKEVVTRSLKSFEAK